MNPKGLVRREFVELVSDYLEDVLSPSDKARFKKHLKECVGCERYLDQMRITIASLGSLSVEKMQPETMDEFSREFRDWHSEFRMPAGQPAVIEARSGTDYGSDHPF